MPDSLRNMLMILTPIFLMILIAVISVILDIDISSIPRIILIPGFFILEVFVLDLLGKWGGTEACSIQKYDQLITPVAVAKERPLDAVYYRHLIELTFHVTYVVVHRWIYYSNRLVKYAWMHKQTSLRTSQECWKSESQVLYCGLSGVVRFLDQCAINANLSGPK